MTALGLLFYLTLGWAVGATYWAWMETHRVSRAYHYAVERADFTEQGRAYSDMATVLVLAAQEVPK